MIGLCVSVACLHSPWHRSRFQHSACSKQLRCESPTGCAEPRQVLWLAATAVFSQQATTVVLLSPHSWHRASCGRGKQQPCVSQCLVRAVKYVLAGEMLQDGGLRQPLQVAGRHIGIALVSGPHHPLQAFQHREGLYVVHSLA